MPYSFLLVVSFPLALAVDQPAGGAVWRAGAAKVCITPEKFMWMSGYAARTKPAEGKHTDLWAKALVIEDSAKTRVVLVTLDLVGIGRELSVDICQKLQRRHKLPREAIILNVSHTHSGPVVGNNLLTMYTLDEEQQQLVRDYARTLKSKILEVVEAAHRDLAPARLTWGVGRCSVAVNRRTNKEADVPKLREAGQLKGPVDHDVPVLGIWPRQEKANPRAIVFGYACHATVLSGYVWSGDYPGWAQVELEKRFPGAVALFWAGCGGDQNPLPRRTIPLAEQYGREVAAGVAQVLQGKMQPAIGQLAAAYREIDLPLAKLPSRDELAEQARDKNRYIAARARMLLEQMQAGTPLRATYPYPVQAWQLGNGPTLVALGGEVVVDYALRLKKELGPQPAWIMGYANDVMAYIPSLRVLREGGYEGGGSMVYYGMPGLWGEQVEEQIVAAVRQQAERVRAAAQPR